MPRSSDTIRHEPKNFFNKSQKTAERHRKENRTPIRPPQMYKKIIMQKNMQKINLCRPGMQRSVDMLRNALKRPTMAFCSPPIREYPQRLKWP